MTKQPVADCDLCIGSGHCVEVCPNVFELVEEKSEVIGFGKCNICKCQEVIDTCPVQAITWAN